MKNNKYTTDFVKRKIDKWADYMVEFDLPSWDSLPSIGLYMDQVITLMSQYLGYLPFSESKNSESFITPNAINNYVRLGAMPAPFKKKYYKLHIAYLIMICVMKPSLSISDISDVIPADLTEEQLEALYTRFRDSHKSTSYNLVKYLSSEIEDPKSDSDVAEIIINSAITASLCKRLTEKTSALKGLKDEKAEAEMRAKASKQK